jgi:uncharacterized protein (DUF2235 family)
MNNYVEGDEIFMFGFSRGAFTARVLANFVARVGIFRKPTYTWELKQAYQAYKLGREAFKVYLEKLAANCVMDKKFAKNDHLPRALPARIKVVGCWDTVASIGIPDYSLTRMFGFSGHYDYLDGGLVSGKLHCLFYVDTSDQFDRD